MTREGRPGPGRRRTRPPAAGGRGRRSVRFAEMPRPARWAVASGGAGAVAGLIIGLVAYPPTAIFAAVELAIPSAVLGALVGALVTLFVRGYRHTH